MFHRLLDFENELFAIVTAALDRQSLLNGNSSFAESLYGLRRSSVRGEANSKSSLDRRSQRRSLFCLVSCCSLVANTVASPYELLQSTYWLHRLPCHTCNPRWKPFTTGTGNEHARP